MKPAERYAILIVATNTPGHPAAGQYVKSYDPDASDGRGFVEGTRDPEKALTFPDFASAMMAWKRPSTVRPLREDGKPNRPLTASTVQIVNLDLIKPL